MAVGFGGAAGGDGFVHEGGKADGPLEGLLGSHGEADDGAEVLDVELFGEELVDGVDVVADGHDGEAGAVEWGRGVGGGGAAAVAEELRGDEEELAGVECAGWVGGGFEEEGVAVEVGHIVGREEDGVGVGGVEGAVGAVDDVGFGEDGAGFGVEVVEDEFVALGCGGLRCGGLGEGWEGGGRKGEEQEGEGQEEAAHVERIRSGLRGSAGREMRYKRLGTR